MNPEGHRDDQLRVGLAENRQRQASGDAVDPTHRPDTLQNRFKDLRQAIDDLGRVLVQGAPGGFPPFDALYERIVERFDWLAEYVDSLPLVDVTSWKWAAVSGWVTAIALFGVIGWARWFQ